VSPTPSQRLVAEALGTCAHRHTDRAGFAQAFSEWVATSGLPLIGLVAKVARNVQRHCPITSPEPIGRTFRFALRTRIPVAATKEVIDTAKRMAEWLSDARSISYFLTCSVARALSLCGGATFSASKPQERRPILMAPRVGLRVGLRVGKAVGGACLV
jgi:hypothetical protein